MELSDEQKEQVRQVVANQYYGILLATATGNKKVADIAGTKLSHVMEGLLILGVNRKEVSLLITVGVTRGELLFLMDL